jgi:hypothetical protein
LGFVGSARRLTEDEYRLLGKILNEESRRAVSNDVFDGHALRGSQWKEFA